MKKVSMLSILVLSIVTFMPSLVIAGSPAEDMVGVMPDSVLGFAVTSGGDSVAPAFNASALGKLWNSPDVQKFYLGVKGQVFAKIETEGGMDDDDKKAFELAMELLNTAKMCPIIGGAAVKGSDAEVPVYGFVIVKAGERKEAMAKILTELNGLADPGEIVDVKVGEFTMHGATNAPLYYGWAGEYFVIGIGDDGHEAIKNLSNPDAGTAGAYFSRLEDNGDALAIYVDLNRSAKLIKETAERNNSGDEIETIAKVIKELGLSQIDSLSLRAGFSGLDLVCDELIEMPSPRTGIFTHIKPIDMSMFNVVDENAVTAITANVDINGIYGLVLSLIEGIAPPTEFAKMEDGIAGFEEMIGVSIREDIMGSLTGKMVVYTTAPGKNPEAPRGAIAFIAETDDAESLAKALDSLGELAAEESDGVLQVSSIDKDGQTYRYWTAMPLAIAQVLPSWTIADGYLVIATCPSLCEQAVARIKADSPNGSLGGDAGFAIATANLPDELLTLKYVDTKAQFKQMMTTMQQFWPMATMFLTSQGVALPAMLPTGGEAVESMTPSYEYTWFDDSGLRYHYNGSGIEANLGAVGGLAIGTAVVMPALSKVKSQAQEIVLAADHGYGTMQNLKQIGLGCHLYANDHDGVFPTDLNVLVAEYGVEAEMIVSSQKPADFEGPSFIIVTGQTIDSPLTNILIYENTEYLNHGCSSINALYCDGHVEKIDVDRFITELMATYDQMGVEMPVIRFMETEVGPGDEPGSIEVTIINHDEI